MENTLENAHEFMKGELANHLMGGEQRQKEIARTMFKYANEVLLQHGVVRVGDHEIGIVRTLEDDKKAKSIKLNGGTLWFIEHKDTGLWWYHTSERKEDIPCTCGKCYPNGYPFKKFKDGWTDDPQKAEAFISKEQADRGIFFYYTNEPETKLISTEHEFTPSNEVLTK